MFTFNESQFNRLFPFYILMDSGQRIKSFGNAVSKLYDLQKGHLLSEYLAIKRPSLTFEELQGSDITNQIILFCGKSKSDVVLRGQFEYLHEERDNLLFIGTPWFDSVEQVVENGLTIRDFATHDPMIDLLHVLKNQEIATEETRILLNRVDQQRFALKNDKSELKRRENMLYAISLATDELLSNTDFSDAVSKCFSLLGNVLGVDKVYLFENGVDAGLNHTMTQKMMWSSRPLPVSRKQLQNIPLSILGSYLGELMRKEPVSILLDEVPQDSEMRKIAAVEDVRSAILVPVFYKNDFWGFIAYTDALPGRIWNDADLALLKSFSNSVANALERSTTAEEMYKMALFATENPDPVMRINLQGRVLLRNEAAKKLRYFNVNGVRYDDDQFFGLLTKNLSDPAWQSCEAVCEEKIYQVTTRLSETREHINIYASDVTTVKRTEVLLKESNERLSTLILNLQTGVLLEDETRHVVLTNTMFCDMFGIPAPPEALIGADCSGASEQSKHLFKDPVTFIKNIDHIIAQKQPVLSEQIELVDGRVFERDYIPIIVSELHRGHLWKYRDITEQKNYERNLKKQEEKYRSIIENMNLGLIEVDLEDEIQYANQTFCQISEYAFDELYKKKASVLFGDGKVHQLIDAKKDLRKKGVSDSYQLQVRNKKGELRWWLISGAPSYNDAGALTGSIGIHLDITEQKNLEEELRIAKHKAEESSKAKESFLANMSHEIRTPLNAIIGMVRELVKTDLSQNQRAYVGHAGLASQHLLSIVNNILDISKIEAGELHLEKINFNLVSVFQETEAIMSQAAREKLLDLKFIINTDLAPAFVGDPNRIRQILLNIMSNSIKFTEKGNVTVECRPVEMTNTGQQIQIVISDTGIGMEKEYLKSLFSKFTQEDVSTGRKYGGTGLGMAITHELVQLMGGNIVVDSEKGKGTSFKIMIRLDLGDENELEKISFSERACALKNKKILLVEDNELNRLVAINSLSFYGIEVIEAVNGLEAIELLKKSTFDLILMDLQMPIMGGLEATATIRNVLQVDTPIIALTANAFKNEIDKCLRAGMNDYVTKTFEEKVLVSVIRRYIKIDSEMLPNENNAAPKSEALLYNLTMIHDLSRGNRDFVVRMIEMFCANASEGIAKIKSSFSSGDYDEVRRIAHKLKPGIDNMGVESIRSDIRFLENMQDESHQLNKIQLVISKIEQVIHEVTTTLSARELGKTVI